MYGMNKLFLNLNLRDPKTWAWFINKINLKIPQNLDQILSFIKNSQIFRKCVSTKFLGKNPQNSVQLLAPKQFQKNWWVKIVRFLSGNFSEFRFFLIGFNPGLILSEFLIILTFSLYLNIFNVF